jgi:hypothetical protein
LVLWWCVVVWCVRERFMWLSAPSLDLTFILAQPPRSFTFIIAIIKSTGRSNCKQL